MANPSYYQPSPSVRSQVQHQEHIFHLYAHQLHRGSGANERNIVKSAEPPNKFGSTYVVGWDIREGPEATAKLVARFQGLVIAATTSNANESWYTSFNMVFTNQWFKGSTLNVQGPLGPVIVGDKGDWAVVGGTGKFELAQGICSYKKIKKIEGGMIHELRIRVVCVSFPKQAVPVQKVGPWGGSGGSVYEIQDAELPQRLESVTIYANDFIQSIAFSYVDKAGQRRTVGPWGGDATKKTWHKPIQFGPSETVKEIYGSTGHMNYHGVSINVVTSLTIVTNVRPYGPYGKQSMGNNPFHVAAPSTHDIVGFYGRAGAVVDQIGAYVSPN